MHQPAIDVPLYSVIGNYKICNIQSNREISDAVIANIYFNAVIYLLKCSNKHKYQMQL
jgi:hypothetical protein